MSAKIHEWSCVDPSAQLADDCVVGPFSMVGAGTVIGPGCVIMNNASVLDRVTLGRANTVYPYAVIGGSPQVKGFDPGAGRLVVGDENTFREYVTVNRGVERYGAVTQVGSHGLFMACCHVAHDCTIGDNVVLGNTVLLGGHITVGDGAYICGGSAAHHFTTFGRLAYVGGMSRIVHDIPPFMKAEGSPARDRAVNDVGLRRHGYVEPDIDAIWRAYRLIWRSDLPRVQALATLENDGGASNEVKELVAFLRRAEKGRHGRYKESLREEHAS